MTAPPANHTPSTPKGGAGGADLLDALERISNLTSGGPHMSAKDGMGAALDALDHARFIARAAIARARGQS